ncbi:MAG: hypothetical protein IID08_03630 [Candidatus Hydrogenedentes bacterium]|nr:hypothetical protein [Candidatus Hydrogenedentota bacterium]
MNKRTHIGLGRLALCTVACVVVLLTLVPHAHTEEQLEQHAKPCTVCQMQHVHGEIGSTATVADLPSDFAAGRPLSLEAIPHSYDTTSTIAPRAPPAL